MALYEDGGVSFAQEQFEQARKRREKEAKKQEKFAKRLQLANLAITGANFVLNQKADKLEREGYINRAHYLTQNENSKGWQDMYQSYKDLGYTNQQMLEAETRKQLETYIQAQVGEDKDIRQFNDAISDISNRFSSDAVNLESWNKVIETQLAIPKLSEADLLELIKKDGAAPRTVAGWLGNKALKIAKSHDEDTLSEEDKLAKKKILGGLIGERFDATKAALKDWADKGNAIGEFKEFLLSEEGQRLTAFSNLSQQVIPFTDRYGRENKYIGSFATDESGQTIQIGNLVPVSIDKSKPKIDRDIKELAQEARLIEDYVNRANDSELDDNFKLFKNNPDAYTAYILDTADELKFNDETMTENDARALATKYVLSQDTEIVDTKMSAFDVASIRGSISTEDINMYADSILKVKPSWGHEQELKAMRNTIQELILNSDNSADVKQEDLNELNKIMSEYNIIPSKDENDIITNNDNTLDEKDKSFLKELNEVPYVGKVSEFMFGDKFGDEITDWAVFIPGLGLAGQGLKGTIKLVVPTVAKKVLSSKSSQAFIQKAGSRIQKGFKTDVAKDNFIKGLSPLQKAIFNSMSATGKSVDSSKFVLELAKMPGVYISGSLPFATGTFGKVGWGLGSTAYIYSRTKEAIRRAEQEEDNQD